jgi:hypothetical protein
MQRQAHAVAGNGSDGSPELDPGGETWLSVVQAAAHPRVADDHVAVAAALIDTQTFCLTPVPVLDYDEAVPRSPRRARLEPAVVGPIVTPAGSGVGCAR